MGLRHEHLHAGCSPVVMAAVTAVGKGLHRGEWAFSMNTCEWGFHQFI